MKQYIHLIKLFLKKSFLVLIFVLLSAQLFAAKTVFQPYGRELAATLRYFEYFAVNAQKDWHIPGMAIAIVRDNEVIYSKGFGVRKLGESRKVNEHTIFQIGSMSKAFTAALISMMIDEGKFKWNDYVINHLPNFMMYDPWVTRQCLVKDLMAQHSGLPEYSGDFQAILGFDQNHIKHSLRDIKPITSFRSAYAYQNNLFLVANDLLEKYSKNTWQENIKKRIFTPLGMKESSATVSDFVKANNVAYLHQMYDGTVKVIPMDWPYISWIDTYAPAGGINSSINDLSRWAIFQLNHGVYQKKRLISEENMDFMHAPQTLMRLPTKIFDYNSHYAQGWAYYSAKPYPIIWHTGGTSGASTIIALIPDVKVALIVLTNLGSTNFPIMLMQEFYNMYFHLPYKNWNTIFLDKKRQDEAKEKVKYQLQRPATDPLILTAYVGNYHNDIYGDVVVKEEKDQLMMILEPRKLQLTLKPWNRDTFKASWPDEDKGVLPPDNRPTFVSFDLNIQGEVTALTINLLNEDSLGRFEKIMPPTE